MREISHVEIIDIADDEVLRSRWGEFIPYHHDIVVREFWNCSIARWPRRTAEWKISASLYAEEKYDAKTETPEQGGGK
jgi:hypothetical protein